MYPAATSMKVLKLPLKMKLELQLLKSERSLSLQKKIVTALAPVLTQAPAQLKIHLKQSVQLLPILLLQHLMVTLRVQLRILELNVPSSDTSRLQQLKLFKMLMNSMQTI